MAALILSKPDKSPITPERVKQILEESMKNKSDLNRYLSSQFELSPLGYSLRINKYQRTKP